MRGLNGVSVRLSSPGWKGGQLGPACWPSQSLNHRRWKSRLGHILVSVRHTETAGFRTGACRHHHSTDAQKNDMVPP